MSSGSAAANVIRKRSCKCHPEAQLQSHPEAQQQSHPEAQQQNDPEAGEKLTGLRALYFKYCLLLGTVKNHPERIQRPSYLLREDVLKLDRFIAKATLPIDNKIETVTDLQAHREGLQASVAHLTAERQDLRNTLRRAERAEDEPAKRDCATQIKQVSTSLRKVRKEVKLCDEIETSFAPVSEKLRDTREYSNKEISRYQNVFSEDITCAQR